MYIRKNFPIKTILGFTWFHIAWLTLWGAVAVGVFEFLDLPWLAIPWLPVSLIGTAVAFYLGFKNNSSYDRLWEARKIWGAIVNTSRSWSTMVKNYTSDHFANDPVEERELEEIRLRLVRRHTAWLFTLRQQLLKPAPWEKINGFITKRITRQRTRRINEAFKFEPLDETLARNISKEEMDHLETFANKATQLLDLQSQELKELHRRGIIDDFRHMSMQEQITAMYDHQGKCERIKNFPFPRQYASTSFYFIGLFILLLPFGMLGEFKKLGEGLIWLTTPFTAMVGWVFITMELVGDYSENPFENMGNDIPMYSMCRGIEIDIKQMVGDPVIPEPIKPVGEVQM